MESANTNATMEKTPSFLKRFYNEDKIDWKTLLFSNQAIKNLLIPIMIEQFLLAFMGMADTVMVTRVGSAAISAVSLTDSINVLVIQIFSALAAGGTIICSQYIGHKDPARANHAARQLLLIVSILSVSIALICFFARAPLLALIFGKVDTAVMENSLIYMAYTAVSFPFIALFQAGSSFYRACGNSRFPMIVSVISNLMNIIGNAVFIFLFHWGVMGAALATLISRVFCAIVVMVCLRRPNQMIVIREYLIRPDWKQMKKILYIAIPSGIENGMFSFGKLVIQSSVSTLGTTAIAANAMMIIFENLNTVPGLAVGIGLMTAVGQAVGAGRDEEAKYYVVKFAWYGEIALIIGCAIVQVIAAPVMLLSGMETESMRLCMQMCIYITVMKPIFWALSFILAYGYRAAGDVRFSMIVSMLSMWLCRVLMATVLIRVVGMGAIAVWISMSCDWIIRAIAFSLRFKSGKWLEHKVL